MRILSLPALAATLLCLTADASAQSFSGFGPMRALVMPASPDRKAPVQPAAEPVTQPAVREPGPRRLSSIAAPLRLWGENGEVTFTLYATEAEARAGGRFQLGYLAAISVLPDVSSLTLALNGATIGTTAIDGARGLRLVTVDVPPGALAHGFNALRITASQRHRVDCTVAATYELWTQIDPETTGFLSSASGPVQVADLAALSIAADGALPIRLLQTGERLSGTGVERLLGAVQDVVLMGRFLQPSVEFAPAPGSGDGLAIAAAPASELARAIDLAPLGPVTRPRLAVLPGSAERRPVLVATGTSDADVSEALAELSRLRAQAPQGTPAGLRALADAQGRRIEGGESLTLADLGLSDVQTGARTHRVAFDLALPHDFLPADYDRLTLDLDASYAAGLLPGAQINVDINGTNAGSAPLGRAGGESFSRRAIFLPLRMLRPGLNRIAINAELPRAGDEACSSDANSSDTKAETERFRLLASTRLTIPPLARIARQPELAETLSSGFPYTQSARRPTLSVPAPDRDGMAAAATFAARLGLAAGRPIPFAFAAGRGSVAGPTIVVSPAPRLDPQTVSATGLDPKAVRDAWAGRETIAAAKNTTPGARRKALQRDAVTACRARPASSATATELASVTDSGPDLGGASAVLTQAVTGPASDDLLTLVTAPSAAALREAVDCLVHPRVWFRPQGKLAILSASDGTVESRADEAPRYIATADPSLTNMRRVAAGWLSLHTGIYGAFALLIAGCLAGSTQLLVRNLGRRQK